MRAREISNAHARICRNAIMVGGSSYKFTRVSSTQRTVALESARLARYFATTATTWLPDCKMLWNSINWRRARLHECRVFNVTPVAFEGNRALATPLHSLHRRSSSASRFFSLPGVVGSFLIAILFAANNRRAPSPDRIDSLKSSLKFTSPSQQIYL